MSTMLTSKSTAARIVKMKLVSREDVFNTQHGNDNGVTNNFQKNNKDSQKDFDEVDVSLPIWHPLVEKEKLMHVKVLEILFSKPGKV